MTRGAPARRGPRPFALHLTAARAAWAGPDASREDRQRFVAFVEGVRRYHAHPFRRPVRERPVVWSAGSSRLLDGGQPRSNQCDGLVDRSHRTAESEAVI